MKRFALLATLLLLASPALAQWVPAPGVPAPAFGLTETPGPVSVYVNEATGSDNNSGSPSRPKRTIPRVLEAGTVVQVIGPHTTAYTSPNTLTCKGTKAAPVFILGGAFTRGGELVGTYCILDGGSGSWTIQGASLWTVIRHYQSGGMAVSGSLLENIVFWDVHIKGSYVQGQLETGGDSHGFAVGRSRNVWVLDSSADAVSGDGIQVNGGPGGETTTGPVYIARMTCDGNRQSCWWAKQSHDVVVSGGSATNMRPDRDFTNPGVCGGGQYFAVRLVFVGILCEHSENGVLIAGFDTEALATPETSGIAIFASTFRDIHATRSRFDPANPRSPGNAITLVGASKRHLEGNTIDDADGGISVAYGTYTNVNNTLTRIGSVPQPPPTLPKCSTIPNLGARFVAWVQGKCVR